MKTTTGNYNAIVCKLTNVRPHPNADRLQIANAVGYAVIVGLEAREGDVGIVFPEGGKLSHEMLEKNSLYRKHPVTGEPMGGYFESNGRVRACKLRGQVSEAFFTTPDSVSWARTDGEGPALEVGDEFDTLDGNVICEKYYTPATQRAMARAARAFKKPWWMPKIVAKWYRKRLRRAAAFDPCPTFAKHFSTTKIRNFTHMIEPGLNAFITSKRHGTSGRTGLVPYTRSKFFGLWKKTGMEYVTGSRNVVKYPKCADRRSGLGYYGAEDFRKNIHDRFAEIGLRENEIVYYEILGFSDEATPIMPNHVLKWEDFKSVGFTKAEFEELQAKYGTTIGYHYGNEPGEFHVEVYRITLDGVDLSQEQIDARCAEIGVETVPKIGCWDSGEDLMEICNKYAEFGEGGGQLREGVVVRLEQPDGTFVKCLKYKSSTFCILEGIKRNDVEYVDMEEVS